MVGISNYGAFLLAGILLNLTPGNDTMYILSQSIACGRKAGVYSALGIGTGSILHTTFAAFGLSLIIAQSLLLFTMIKYAGALYLVYLGITMFRNTTGLAPNNAPANLVSNHVKTYRDAVLTNLFNPKVALFFIAFLPQFIDPTFRHSVVPFLALGLTFTFTGTLWCLVLARFAADLSARLRLRPVVGKMLHRVSGSILLVLGAKLAFSRAK